MYGWKYLDGLTDADILWLGANEDTICSCLAYLEMQEWEKLAGELSLQTLNNIQNACWQIWDTYNEETTLMLLFGRTEGLDQLVFDDAQLLDLIKKIKEHKITDYSWHQYGDYATVFFNFTPTKVEVDSPFINDNCYDHLYEDIQRGVYTVDKLREIVNTTPSNMYD